MVTGETIRADIKERGLTRVEYARLFGVTRDGVYKWLSGQTVPSIQTSKLMKLSTKQLEGLADAETKTGQFIDCSVCGARMYETDQTETNQSE